MTREHQPRTTGRRVGEAAIIAVTGVGATLLLSEAAGAQEAGRTPVVFDQLQQEQQQVFDACQITPSNLYLARGYSAVDEMENGGETDGVPDALFAITTPKPDQGLLAFSRSCLGVTKDTPDPDGTILATVGALTKQIAADSSLKDPNQISTDTQLTVNMSLIADMRRRLETSPKSSNPQPDNPETPKPANSQLENQPIPTPETTTVAPNEGLLAVARRLNIDPQALAAANGYTLTGDYRVVDAAGNRVTLDVGQPLTIPTTPQPDTVQPPQPAKSQPANPQPENPETPKPINSQPEAQNAPGPQTTWKTILDELAQEEENPEYKTLIEQAGVYEIDGRPVTYADIQRIEAERGPDSLSIVFSTAPSQPGTDEEIRSQIDPEKEDVRVAGFYDKCNQDVKWGLTCLVGPNAIPVAVWYVYAHRGGGKPPPAIVQYLSEKVGGKQQNRANEAEAYEAQILAIAQELGGEGADVISYGGRPVLVDPQGNLVINGNGEMISAAPDYKSHPTVAVDADDQELTAAIQAGDIIHMVQDNETTLTGIMRNQMQSVLFAHELRLNPTQVNHLINLWTAAVLATREGDDTVITGREIFIPHPGTVPELAEELVRLQGELHGTAPTPPNTVNSTNMNEGGSVSGPEGTIAFDDLRRIFKSDMIAEHLLLTQPEHARALYDSVIGTSPSREQLISIFKQDLINQVEQGMLALGQRHATEAEYLTFIQSLTASGTLEELEPVMAGLHTDFETPAPDYVPDITNRGPDAHFDTFASSYQIAEALAIAREFSHNKDFLDQHREQFERLYPSLWPQLSQSLSLSNVETDRLALDTMREDLWEALKTEAYLRGLIDRQDVSINSFPEQLDFLRNFHALVGEEAYQAAIQDVIDYFQKKGDRIATNQQLDAMILSAISRFAQDPSIVLPTEDPSHHDNLRPLTDYNVRAGDTLYSLAKRYDTTVEDLMALNGLSSDQIQVNRYIMVPHKDPLYPTNTNGMMSENMGPGGGPAPENDPFLNLLAQITDPAARMYAQTHPTEARALVLGNTDAQQTASELHNAYIATLNQQLQGAIAQGLDTSQIIASLEHTATTADLAAFAGTLAVDIDTYRLAPGDEFTVNDLLTTLTQDAPDYADHQEFAQQYADFYKRFGASLEDLMLNPQFSRFPPEEQTRLIYMQVNADVARALQILASGIDTGAGISQAMIDQLKTTFTPDELAIYVQMGIQQFAQPGNPQYAPVIERLIEHAADKVGLRAPGSEPLITPERMAERVNDVLSKLTDPIALTLVAVNPDLASATIAAQPLTADIRQVSLALHEAYAQQFGRGIADLVLRNASDEEWLMFYAEQTTADNVDAFARELLDRTTTATEQEYYQMVMYYLAVTIPQYQDYYQDQVENNAELLRSFYPGLYQEHINRGYNSDEALRLQYEAMASGVLASIEQHYGTNPNMIATEYDTQAMDWVREVLGPQAWDKWVKQNFVDTGMPPSADMSPVVLELLRQSLIINHEVNIGDTLGHQEADTNQYVPEDDPNSMNRTDDSAAGSGTAGEGNGIDVQAGDTMTQPIVEADKRGDNIVETPPTQHVNPSAYNPDGTPINPPGQEAMESPMVTPDMAGSVANENQGTTSTDMAMADAAGLTATSSGTASTEGSSTAVPNTEKPTAPLTNEQIYKIIQEDGAAIEAYIQSQHDQFGPDPLVQMADMNNYIQTHPEEIRRIMEREWKKMHPDQEWNTQWVWEDIDPAVKDAVVKALIVVAAGAAAVGNTLSGSGA